MRSEEKNRWIECGRGGTQTLTNDLSSITNEEKNLRGGKGKKKTSVALENIILTGPCKVKG